MKKDKTPKLEAIAVIGQFKDGKCREFLINENTKRAIINIIVMIEGTINVLETPLEGITLEKKELVK